MAFPSSSGWTLSLNVSQLEQESYPSRPTRSDYSPSQLRPTQQQQSNLSPTTTPSSTRSSLIESANTSVSQSTHKARLLSNQELQKMRDESEGNKEVSLLTSRFWEWYQPRSGERCQISNSTDLLCRTNHPFSRIWTALSLTLPTSNRFDNSNKLNISNKYATLSLLLLCLLALTSKRSIIALASSI